jgi:hypothetical protein
MTDITSLLDLDNLEAEDSLVLTTEDENYGEILLNFENSESSRIDALNMCSDDEKIEYITRLIGMYQFTPVSVIESFLKKAVTDSSIESLLKLECAKCLETEGLESVSYIISNENLPSPCRIEAIHLLLQNENYNNIAEKHFINFVNDYTIDCEFRYKNIIQLEQEGLNVMTEHLCWKLDFSGMET